MIHIDRKSEIPIIKANYSGVVFLKDRIDVRWGDVSQVESELALFSAAYREDYDYYHLLSGSDLPIKSNDYIDAFFQEHSGKEFVGFNMNDPNDDRINRWHFLTKYYKSSICIRVVLKPFRMILENFMNILFPRKVSFQILKKGSNWVSVSGAFCKYMLERKEEIIRTFQHTICADEHFVQTLIWASPFRSNIFNIEDEFKGNLREIDWLRGKPYIWGGG